MSGFNRTINLAEVLLWKQLRSQGLRLLIFPVALAVFFVAIIVGSAQSPQTMTPTTQRSVERMISIYFVDVDGQFAYALAMFLLQGPYLLTLFAGIIGVRVAAKTSSKLISSGRFELLLSAPYSPKRVFQSLLVSTTLITLILLVIFATIAIGGPLLYLTVNGIAVTDAVSTLLLIGFLLPFPIALWANLVVILGNIGIGGERLQNLDELFSFLGILPGVALVLTISIFPTLDILQLTLATLIASVSVTVGCTYWVNRTFTAERILPKT